MKLASGVGIVIGGLIALGFMGCRSKAKRRVGPKPSVSVVSAPSAIASAALSANEIHREARPIDLAEYSTIRSRALSAIRSAADPKTPSGELLAPLAQALTDAPGSAVLAIELAKAALRAHDQRRTSRYIQIAQPLAATQPKLKQLLAAINGGKHKVGDSAARAKTNTPSKPAVKLDGLTELGDVCKWLKKAFVEGRPPVDDVGLQGTDSIDCQMFSRFALTPDIQAAPVLVAAGARGESVFAWVAAQAKGTVWLSPVVAESFSPSIQPYGNGFTFELQRAAAYGGNNPELTAYLVQRRTVIDVALNEEYVVDEHRIRVMTFDRDPPEVSAPVVLHSRQLRSLVDAQDKVLPKGYGHSPDLGQPSEQSYQLKWGDNRVQLTPIGQPKAAPTEQILFAE
jgi:hypothetical protein